MNSEIFAKHIERMLELKSSPAEFIAHVTELSEPLTALQFMIRLHSMSPFWSMEQNRNASNSEIRRWIEQGGITFNGEKMQPNETIDFPLFSLIMFPKSESRRCTLL